MSPRQRVHNVETWMRSGGMPAAIICNRFALPRSRCGFIPTGAAFENFRLRKSIDDFLAHFHATDADVGSDGGPQVTGGDTVPGGHDFNGLAHDGLSRAAPTRVRGRHATPSPIGNQDRNAVRRHDANCDASKRGLGGIAFWGVARKRVARDLVDDVRMNLLQPRNRPRFQFGRGHETRQIGGGDSAAPAKREVLAFRAAR